MPSPYSLKDQEILPTPVLLFDCTLANGAVERWSTHAVTFETQAYAPRVLAHTAFDLRASGEDGIEAVARISVSLANADSRFSQLERNSGIKGARLHVRFVFFDLKTGAAASEAITLFRGIANPPDETTEATMRLSFTNRLSPSRMLMPQVRIQKRCPWLFPSTANEREEAVTGLDRAQYSPFFRCGYSPDQAEGVGSLNPSTGQPYPACDYSRTACEQRGMFARDSANRATRRFGGVEFVPASILVRGAGEAGARVSEPVENETRYNDFVPMVYGTAWYEPPIVFARNDGNLTRLEVLLGLGEIQGVTKVIVNDVEIPLGQTGANLTATGWYDVVTLGNRTGAFNLNFTDASGQPLGDPYGSMAYLAVAVPNRVSSGQRLPRVRVLASGLKLSRYDTEANFVDHGFSNNPAWVILDLLRRAGWDHSELDLISFARAAAHCDELVDTLDLHGNAVQIPRYQVNLVLRKRRSLAELLRGVRNAASLYLGYGPDGRVQLKLESRIAISQPAKPTGSNSTEALFGGWPAYEFGDGTNHTKGLLRRENGEPALRVSSRSTSDSPNRFSLEFQDAFNEYQQDSLSLADAEDVRRVGQELSAQFHALGFPNFDQAARILRLQLDKSLRGNTYVEFETSVRALGVRPGDLITLTYQKEGFDRQLFRVLQVSPRSNYATAVILAQIHDEAWYLQPAFGSSNGRREGSAGLGIPRPLTGLELDSDGQPRFAITELDADPAVRLRIGFRPPAKPSNSAASIPLVALTPEVETTGGTLAGGRSLYYAVAALDAEGAESRLSFIIRATLPSGTNTNRVRLKGLSFSASTQSFVVYRGVNPQQLLRIGNAVPLAASFEDTGAEPELIGPPDPGFAEARFSWRFEVHPETAANIFTATTIGNSTLSLTADTYKGMTVRISKGKGIGQERVIDANSGTTLAVPVPWEVLPDATSRFVISESAWRFGASSATSPVEFEVPGYTGRTVQVLGRSANAHGLECAAELSPLTRWQLGGGAQGSDHDVPPQPVFGLNPLGDGSVQLIAVGFPTLENTVTIGGGTLKLFYWNEHDSPTPFVLDGAMSASETTLLLTSPGPAAAGSLIQIGDELLRVTAVSTNHSTYTVERGVFGSPASAHGAGTPVYHLESNTYVVPFVRNFFGSPASGLFAHPIYLPDVRIAAATFYVTNSVGDSAVDAANFTAGPDQGLRTMSGGQLGLQFDGALAIGSNLTPPLIVERDQAIRDFRAVVNEAPAGGSIGIRILRDGESYGELTIAGGDTSSEFVTGFGKPRLQAGQKLTLDILNVPPSASGTPGRSLTVILRR